MKSIKTVLVLSLTLVMVGCSSSVFTKHEAVAVDTLYIKKQCPTFVHQFEIPGRKYTTNDVTETSVVMKLEDLTVALESNTVARQTFNNTVREMNQEELVKDDSNADNRVVKKIYVDQVCPTYTYSPEFPARKLTETFEPLNQTTYVVIPLEDMVFEVAKHKKVKEVFNEEVEELNSKPFPLNLLSN